MTRRDDQRHELDRLREENRKLEVELGLGPVMERAREGRFIPLGAFGEKVTPEEYFADESDYLRGKQRDAYFSLADVDARKRLITATRAAEAAYRELLEIDVALAKQKVAAAEEKAKHEPWGKAAVLGAAAVGIGYWIFGLPGAIAGGVSGFFLGQWVVAGARNEVKSEDVDARAELEEAQKEKADASLMPEFFNQREELTGQRDASIDNESAWVNAIRKQDAG